MFDHPYSHYVFACEKTIVNRWMSRSFGYYLLHMGDPGFQGLVRSNRIRYPLFFDLDRSNPVGSHRHCQAYPEALPITTESIDVILLTHALENHGIQDLSNFLAEIYRILLPEGTLIITGFHAKNPLARLCRLLKTHDFQIQSGQLLCFTPSILVNMGVQCPLLEKIGPYCTPFLSTAYALLVTKKCVGMTPIRPQWTRKVIIKDNRAWGSTMGSKFTKGQS